MGTQYKILSDESLQAIKVSASTSDLDKVRIEYLGKSGKVTQELKNVGALPVEQRKEAGAKINSIKEEITAAIEAKKSELAAAELGTRLQTEKIDVTLPARPIPQGRIHPVTKVIEEISDIFARQGFSVAEGPDIEDDYHNFEALNFPANHPARQMHDTFYLSPLPTPLPQAGEGSAAGAGEGTFLLRTHTSPVQIRVMKNSKPPMRVIAPGTTYRCDSDLTHTPMFHQVEGFVIDKGIHMGYLKGCLIQFLKAFFEVGDVPVRFRPSFFPFTEPSAEVDIGCSRNKDEIKIGARDDWLEVMGCGMVHPNVLKNCNLDPNEWQGFAFGMGVERLAMLKYGIPDLRTFFESDVRWLQYYGFDPSQGAR